MSKTRTALKDQDQGESPETALIQYKRSLIRTITELRDRASTEALRLARSNAALSQDYSGQERAYSQVLRLL